MWCCIGYRKVGDRVLIVDTALLANDVRCAVVPICATDECFLGGILM